MTDLEALRAIVDHQLRNLLRLPHFPAKVVVQHGDLTVDVQPDSPYLPGISALQLRTFVPGAVVKVAAGARVAVVFEDGDRMRPVAVPVFDADAGSLLELAVVAPTIKFGSSTPADAAALASNTESRLHALEQFAAAHVHTSAASGVPTSPATNAVPTNFPAVASGVVKISG